MKSDTSYDLENKELKRTLRLRGQQIWKLKRQVQVLKEQCAIQRGERSRKARLLLTCGVKIPPQTIAELCHLSLQRVYWLRWELKRNGEL